MDYYRFLESEFARWNGLEPENMVACSCGTAALHLAMEALEFLPGSTVAVPDFTMVACPRAVTMAGHSPMFVDCFHDDPRADYATFAEPVDAAMAVHIYGRICPTPLQLRGAPVVEDLAEAHGVPPHKDSFAACWSFYRNKIIAGEEGGAVWFRDKDRADLARKLRSLGFTDSHDFMHIPRGHNYRLSNAHAKLILESLDRADENIRRRNRVIGWYDTYMGSVAGIEKMPPRAAPWVYDLRIPGMTHDRQDAIIRHLNAIGIAARHAFKPMTAQREYREAPLPNAARMSREVIYLPVDPTMSKDDVIENVEELGRALA